MKIFKHGPAYEYKLCVCENCQCEFEPDDNDEIESGTNDVGDAYTFWTCPDCGCEVVVVLAQIKRLTRKTF